MDTADIMIVKAEDLRRFGEEIATRVLAGIKPTNETEIHREEKPLTQPQAIDFIGKSRQTLLKWRKKGIIKGHKLGGRIYYFESELIAAMQKDNCSA